MPENKIVGYKKIFGFVLPDWVDERQIDMMVGYFLSFVVMMFVLILVINPNSDKINSNKKAIKTEETQLSILKESKKSLDDLGQTLSQQDQQSIFRAMPIDYTPEDAIFGLRGIASKNEVSITEYTLPGGVIFDDTKKEFKGSSSSKEEASVKFQSFPISISVNGKINSILKFVDMVEKSLPIGFVSDLSIQEIAKISNESTDGPVALKLQITYYQPIMVSFNLSNLKAFTNNDLSLIKEISAYDQNIFQLSASIIGGNTTSLGIDNLFGL